MRLAAELHLSGRRYRSSLIPRSDSSGVEGAIRGAVLATKNGGKFCSVGRGAGVSVNFPLFDAADREVDIVGVFRYKNVYLKQILSSPFSVPPSPAA